MKNCGMLLALVLIKILKLKEVVGFVGCVCVRVLINDSLYSLSGKNKNKIPVSTKTTTLTRTESTIIRNQIGKPLTTSVTRTNATKIAAFFY